MPSVTSVVGAVAAEAEAEVVAEAVVVVAFPGDSPMARPPP
jgi:hypothetical protein